MKKSLFLLLALLTASLSASAYDFMVGGLCYNKNSDGTTVTLTYQNNSSPRYSNLSGNLTIPSTVTYSGTSYAVTIIGDNAFRECSGLTSVTIGNSVTTIGGYAFESCTGLTSVTIGNSVASIGNSAFRGCSGLTSVTIPNSVTTIGSYAFYGCSGLTSVTIGNSVTSIGGDSFRGCNSLRFILSHMINPRGDGSMFYQCPINSCILCVPSGSISQYSSTSPWSSFNNIKVYDFIKDEVCYHINDDNSSVSVTISDVKGNVTIPKSVSYNGKTYSVTSIDDYSFYNRIGLTGTLSIPTSVKSIGAFAFSGCRGMTTLTLPANVTTLGIGAFSCCTGLKTVNWNIKSYSDFTSSSGPFNGLTGITNFTFGSSVQKIPAYLCYGMNGLTSVTIPAAVTSIGANAFSGCSGMTSVNISDLVAWLNIDFASAYSNPLSCGHNLYLNGTKVTNLVIPNTVTAIKIVAFYGCRGLTSVTIPNSVTSIGNSAFRGCSGLTSVTIPNSVTSIGNYAFSGCSGLTSVTIPNSVTSISGYAFESCSGLTSVTIPNSVTSIGNSAFYDCRGLTGTMTIPAAVTSIGDKAFYGCSGLTTLTLSANVTTLGTGAFSFCTGLKTVNWNIKSCTDFTSSSSPFNGLTGITKFTFGSSVQKIPDYLCYEMSGISSITIPSSVTSIGTTSFGNCTGLKDINYNASNCVTGQLVIPSLETLILGTTVKSIPSEKAFYGCTNLKKIVCNATTPPTNVNSLTFPVKTYLAVPKNLVSVYQQKYTDYMYSSKFTRILPLPLYSFDIPDVTKNGMNYSVINYGRTEEKVSYSEVGVYGNMKKQKASVNSSYDNYFYFKNNSLTNLIPGSSCEVRPYAIIDGKEYAGYWGTNITVDPVQSAYNSTVAPSSLVMTDNTEMPGGISFKKSRLTLDNKSYESYGNAIIVTGLKPNKYYSGTYSVEVSEGTVNNTNVSFYTPSLSLNNQAAKMLTNSTALLQSFTNLSEEETSCGFNWKRYDAPDEMLGNPVYCPVYDGMMMGTLKNLPEGVYYKYRPFYRASDGTLYYGEWVAFYTGDANVQFDPVAHTYDNARVSGSQSIIQGIAIRGSQEITEQGFEYWIDNTKNSMVIDGEENVTIKASSISKVTATGERMSATLNSLKGNTTYAFRAYVKTASGTTYGELRTFRTPVVQASGDVNCDGVVTSYDVTALYNYLLNNDMTHYSTCDINGDGQVTAADVTAIYDILLGN